MNQELLTGAVVAAFLALSCAVELAIDTWWPDLRDRDRCLILVAAAVAVAAVALHFVD